MQRERKMLRNILCSDLVVKVFMLKVADSVDKFLCSNVCVLQCKQRK